MTCVGVDDTDSRERGMCTTYVAARIADRLREETAVDRLVLVRLNPAVEHKTRGNAAVAVHTDCEPSRAFDLAASVVASLAELADPATQPGLVVAPGGPGDVPAAVSNFARAAIRAHLGVDDAHGVIEAAGYHARGWNGGRGRIGALAAVGAWAAYDDWTYEHLAYREPDRWGTPREVDAASVFAAAEAAYPSAWDTVDQGEGEAVCVPRTPCPVLYGVRGDNPGTVRAVARRIDGEPVAASALFATNQGTDAHLAPGRIGSLEDGQSYRATGTIASAPETRQGGHVFFRLRDDDAEVECAAFEPTKRFRNHVRSLRVGDRITACGEVGAGTIKLEKFAVRDLVRIERGTPTCGSCGRRMKSVGAEQGYRCRQCGTTASGQVERPVARDLEPGWYEVPPRARRHIAKPLVRGGFDAPVHPER